MHEFPVSYSYTEWNLFSSALILFCGDGPAIKTKLSDPVFDGVGLTGFKSRANAFLLA